MSALYEKQSGLFSKDMYAPFAERKDNVVQLEFTEGCSHAKCTFCDMYKTKHKEKSIGKARKHIDAVFDSIPRDKVSDLERIWIANGDALSMKPAKLNNLIQYATRKFYDVVGRAPRRTALFASTKNILAHSRGRQLKALNCGGSCWGEKGFEECSMGKYGDGNKHGLGIIYWGVESGSSAVLKYIKKGCDSDDIARASRKLSSAGIKKSVMIMPGAGGILHADSHLEETVDILNYIDPKFITFIGINPAPNSLYARKMVKEIDSGKNRPLTDRELAMQTLDMVDGLDNRANVGCFDTSMQTFGKNPLPFGNFETEDGWHKNDFVKEQRNRLEEKFPARLEDSEKISI